MGIIESQWRERRARKEAGIYHPDDRVAELCGSPSDGYRVDLPAPVSALARDEPAGWVSLREECAIESGDWKVSAGATSAEGGGFIAVEQISTGQLLWLLHVHESDEFTDVAIAEDTIRATSGDSAYGWTIPILDPQALSITTEPH
jgi:hypothetical protein